MNRLCFVLALLIAVSVPAAAQIEIGPRVSNYSTDLQVPPLDLHTGRVSSFGIVGGYRTGSFVLDWMYDHDTQNGINITDIIVDVGDYQRDRGEVTVGFRILPVLDLQGGVRIDQVRIGGVSFLGNPVATDLDIDHQALVAGVRFHSASQGPAGFYVVGRAIVGEAQFRNGIGPDDEDVGTVGYRAEAGIPIRLGESNWTIVPGAEYDHLRADDNGFRMNSNRLFLSLVYSAK